MNSSYLAKGSLKSGEVLLITHLLKGDSLEIDIINSENFHTRIMQFNDKTLGFNPKPSRPVCRASSSSSSRQWGGDLGNDLNIQKRAGEEEETKKEIFLLSLARSRLPVQRFLLT